MSTHSSNANYKYKPEESHDVSLTTTVSSSGSSLYDSAKENQTSDDYGSFNESSNNNTTNSIENMLCNMRLDSSSTLANSSDTLHSSYNSSGSTLFDISSDGIPMSKLCQDENINNINASLAFIKSESSTETNASLDEVDPKSQLANKTIFKTNNPNLSIIEINDTHKDDIDIKNSVVVVEDGSDATAAAAKIALGAGDEPSIDVRKSPNVDVSSDKRRKKPECLLHSSKQKLNVAIAEASAYESATDGEEVNDLVNDFNRAFNEPAVSKLSPRKQSNNDTLPKTKREIEIYDSLEEFEKNLPSTVTVLDTPFGSRVYLIGTAHFSEESQDDVSYVIRNVRPDVVMVELCPSRIHILKLDEKTLLEEAKSFNFAKLRGIIQAHGYINGIFFIMLLQMSAQIAKDLGMAPGGEFRRAFEEIKNLPGCVLHLGDRPVRITLHRALRALSFWQTVKLVLRLLSNDSISIEEVEECKQRDLLEKLMQEMAGEFPAFSDVFVTERDMFLCHSLQLAALAHMNANGIDGLPKPVRVVGVVGIGHANGIAEMWGQIDPHKIPDILTIPPASLSTRIGKATIKYGLIGLTLFGIFKLVRPRLRGFF